MSKAAPIATTSAFTAIKAVTHKFSFSTHGALAALAGKLKHVAITIKTKSHVAAIQGHKITSRVVARAVVISSHSAVSVRKMALKVQGISTASALAMVRQIGKAVLIATASAVTATGHVLVPAQPVAQAVAITTSGAVVPYQVGGQGRRDCKRRRAVDGSTYRQGHVAGVDRCCIDRQGPSSVAIAQQHLPQHARRDPGRPPTQ